MSENEEIKSNSEEVATEAVEQEGTSADTPEEVEAVADPRFKWFIAKAMTGQESKVQRALKERVVNYKQTEFFEDIVVPEEVVVTHAGGKKRTLKKKLYPGYVLIKMIMNDTSWHLVKDTDKVTGFVGGTVNKPTPLSNEEAAYMTNQADASVKKPRATVDFSEGDEVKVTEGPFATFVGTVEAINDKGKIKVNVSIFGRPTPVELDFSQVEKI